MILKNIQALCGKKKITVSRLEKELGFGEGTIRKWDKCSPTVEKISKVANFFHVKIDRLLQET